MYLLIIVMIWPIENMSQYTWYCDIKKNQWLSYILQEYLTNMELKLRIVLKGQRASILKSAMLIGLIV